MTAKTESSVHCRHCQTPLRGRSDKKFCDDRCRNGFNNQKRVIDDRTTRHIHRILLKNRRILKDLYDAGKFRIKKTTLEQLGYRFPYHTHRSRSIRGKTSLCCYDYGIIPTARDGYRLQIDRTGTGF